MKEEGPEKTHLLLFILDSIDTIFVASLLNAGSVHFQFWEVVYELNITVDLLKVIIHFTAQGNQYVQFPSLFAVQQVVVGSVELIN